jgi:hypothetical protein
MRPSIRYIRDQKFTSDRILGDWRRTRECYGGFCGGDSFNWLPSPGDNGEDEATDHQKRLRFTEGGDEFD